MITIDLDGHSKDDVSVAVSWNDIKQMARSLIAECVSQSLGGVRTYGMKNTLQALLEPTSYDDGRPIDLGAIPMPVEQPDGNIDSVAIPDSVSITANGGYSKSFLGGISFSSSLLHHPPVVNFKGPKRLEMGLFTDSCKTYLTI